MNAFVLVYGEQDKLNQMRQTSEEFLNLGVKAGRVLDRVRIVEAYVGDGFFELAERIGKML